MAGVDGERLKGQRGGGGFMGGGVLFISEMEGFGNGRGCARLVEVIPCAA